METNCDFTRLLSCDLLLCFLVLFWIKCKFNVSRIVKPVIGWTGIKFEVVLFVVYALDRQLYHTKDALNYISLSGFGFRFFFVFFFFDATPRPKWLTTQCKSGSQLRCCRKCHARYLWNYTSATLKCVDVIPWYSDTIYKRTTCGSRLRKRRFVTQTNVAIIAVVASQILTFTSILFFLKRLTTILVLFLFLERW